MFFIQNVFNWYDLLKKCSLGSSTVACCQRRATEKIYHENGVRSAGHTEVRVSLKICHTDTKCLFKNIVLIYYWYNQ